MTSHPLTITDEEVRSHFPEDQDLANQLVTEMVRALLIRHNEPPEMKLENRPDWQAEIDQGIQEIRTGKGISHEEHLAWIRQHK